jgi:ferredoxin--NADP+ reductase
LEVEDTKLAPRNGDTRAVGLGTKRVLEVETVIFCIGDRVDEEFGLPVQWNEFVKTKEPRYPVDGASYEVYDPDAEKPVEGVFVAGWSREASSGLVGVARKDGENGARAMLQYLDASASETDGSAVLGKLEERLTQNGKRVVSKEDVEHLFDVEAERAEELGLEHYKMKTNDEMLAAIKS